MNNELLKKYLAKELSSKERNAFEQEIENDPFLTEAIEGLTLQQQDWNQGQLQQLEKNIHADIAQKTRQKKDKKNNSLLFFKYAAAACIFGILTFISWRLFITPKPLDEQAIYASYFHPLTHPDGTVRGVNKQSDETAAIQAYEKEDYFGAVKYYEKLQKNDSTNIKNNLFLGISYLATNQAQKAIDILNKINTPSDFQFDIQWYLGLAYLKNKNKTQAQIIFIQLSKEESYYKNQSAKIADKLIEKTASLK